MEYPFLPTLTSSQSSSLSDSKSLLQTGHIPSAAICGDSGEGGGKGVNECCGENASSCSSGDSGVRSNCGKSSNNATCYSSTGMEHILTTLDLKNLNKLEFWVKKMRKIDCAISNVHRKPF